MQRPKKWGQAHTQGRYVMAQWVYRNQKSKILDFEIIGDNEDFRIHLDEKLLMTEGRDLISELLVVIQTYKSSGAVDRATKFYEDYSTVDDFFLKIRDIVIKNKKPRRLHGFNNMVRYSEKQIDLITYPATFEGIILSYQDRYHFTKSFYKQVMGVWNEHKDTMKVQK
jgi:dipeptidyl-peptidase-3